MGALRALDLSAAVEAAREVFWRAGYEDARMEDVVQATGLNRAALYGAFGGKRDLFLKVLADYQATGKGVFLEGLNDETLPPLMAIRRVCAWAIGEMSARGTGCLVHNIAVDEARSDPLIAARVREYTSEIEKGFELALVRARERGELSPAISPEAGARHLMVMKLGLGAFARAGATQGEMIAALDAGLALLGCVAGEAGRRVVPVGAAPLRDAQSRDPVKRKRHSPLGVPDKSLRDFPG